MNEPNNLSPPTDVCPECGDKGWHYSGDAGLLPCASCNGPSLKAVKNVGVDIGTGKKPVEKGGGKHEGNLTEEMLKNLANELDKQSMAISSFQSLEPKEREVESIETRSMIEWVNHIMGPSYVVQDEQRKRLADFIILGQRLCVAGKDCEIEELKKREQALVKRCADLCEASAAYLADTQDSAGAIAINSRDALIKLSRTPTPPIKEEI